MGMRMLPRGEARHVLTTLMRWPRGNCMEQTYAFVDLAGFSALTGAHGDTPAADLVERFTELVDPTLAGDAVVTKRTGDARSHRRALLT